MSTRKYAEDLLTKYKVFHPPVNPEKIAEDEGVDVVFVDFEDEAAAAIHGFYDHEDRSIVVNSRDSSEEKMFTIAHELGHHVMHKEYSAGQGYVPRMKFEVDSKEEKEADEFATYLLAPSSVVSIYSELFEDADLRSMFLVSQKVLDKAKKG